MSKTLVLFDFDGTLTKRDTFPQFVFFSQGYMKGLLGVLLFSPTALLFFLKIINGDRLKEKLVAFYFKGKNKHELEAWGLKYIENLHQTNGFRDDMLEKLKEHISNNNEVCIVSASLDVWIGAFCRELNIQCLCTELCYENGIFKGSFNTPNCNGEEKAVRIKKRFELKEYSKIFAYGNSAGDKAMFSLATEVILIR